MSETCKQNNIFCFIPPEILGAEEEQTLLKDIHTNAG